MCQVLNLLKQKVKTARQLEISHIPCIVKARERLNNHRVCAHLRRRVFVDSQCMAQCMAHCMAIAWQRLVTHDHTIHLHKYNYYMNTKE